jgi:hypothetical protein
LSGFEGGVGEPREERKLMSLLMIAVLVLILMAVLPTWPYSSGWGYYPSGGLGLVVLVLIVLLLTGRL